jgi:type II secretory pathway pseudopilin PulG
MSRCPRAFTIVELLVVVATIGLLIGILLPAIGKAREQALLTRSEANLRQLGVAHATYAGEWNDRQFTLCDDNLGRYGSNAPQAMESYQLANGLSHPPLILGWGPDGGLWAYFFGNVGDNNAILQPISFTGPLDGEDVGDNYAFGWFRMINCRQFSRYLNGRFYDPVFYAPKDRMAWTTAELCMQSPGEFCFINSQSEVGNVEGGNRIIVLSSYCLSAAALFSPDVFGSSATGGFQDPWTLDSGFRCPSMSQARYADLKSHMVEHHWLQQTRADCNPAFVGYNFGGCEPYYFNHSWESVPVTLFFDGHVEGLGVRQAEAADTRHAVQSGEGLWSRDTPFGSDGYFIGVGYDFAATSFHILTTEGIRGRDRLGG